MNNISNRWFYYHDGSNPSLFKAMVISFLNRTTTAGNKPYKGDKSPRYYGMVDGEPFMRKTPDDFIRWGCVQYHSIDDFGTNTVPVSENYPNTPSYVINRVGSKEDLGRTSWGVKSPDSQVLRELNRITGKSYNGRNRNGFYVVTVDVGGNIKGNFMTSNDVIRHKIPTYPTGVISRMLMSSSIHSHHGESPVPPPSATRKVEEVGNSIMAERYAKEVERRVEANNDARYYREKYNELRKKIENERMIKRMEKASRDIEAVPLTEFESHPSSNKEQTQGIKMTSALPAPITMKRRRK